MSKYFLYFTLFLFQGLVAYNLEISALSVASFVICFFVVLWVFDFLVCRKVDLGVSCYLAFHIVFFLVAPQVQLLSVNVYGQFVNTMPVTDTAILYSNFLATLFLVFVVLGRFTGSELVELRSSEYRVNKFRMLVLFGVVCVIFVAFFNAVLIDIYDRVYREVNAYEEQSIVKLLKNKVLFVVPFVFMLYVLRERLSGRVKYSFIILCLIPVALFLKNPILENRNAVGPLYLCVVYLVLPSLFLSNFRIVSLFLMVLVVVFPLLSFVSHSHLRDMFFSGDIGFLDIFQQINSVHYDAWSNIYAAVEMVSVGGFSYGLNFLGSLLFFVPRGVWGGKPHHSGNVLGDYLMGSHSMWFDNLSFPLVSESYYSFGFIGVVLVAFFFGRLLKFINSFQLSSLSKVFLCFSVFYICRGSLMPAFSYTLSGFCVFYFVDKAIFTRELKFEKNTAS